MTYWWLKYGDIKGETKNKIVATQDEAISTNYFKNKILKEETDSKCWLYKEHEEATDHPCVHFGEEWALNETL